MPVLPYSRCSTVHVPMSALQPAVPGLSPAQNPLFYSSIHQITELFNANRLNRPIINLFVKVWSKVNRRYC
jgi:hypothetical protein